MPAQGANSFYVSCKPQVAHTILSEPGIHDALEGKLLISILAGVTIRQLTEMVPSSTRVVRAMPNTPCKVRQIKLSISTFIANPARFAKA